MKRLLTFSIAIFSFCGHAFAQSEKEQLIKARVDTTGTSTNDTIPKPVTDTVVKKKHIPRKATFRSAVLPGWGQAYNGEAWKIPFVYAVVGVPAGFYIYNTTWYKRTKLAYEIAFAKDTARFPKIHKDITRRTDEGHENYLNRLQLYRNSFRRDRDYSILYFLIAWGVNVADATVFGHLRDFDVSDDLSLKLKPGFSELGNTAGLSLVLAVKPLAQQRNHTLRPLP